MSHHIKPYAEAPFTESYGQFSVWDYLPDGDPLAGQPPQVTPSDGESLMRDCRDRMDVLIGRTVVAAACSADGVCEIQFDNGEVLILPDNPRTPQYLWKHGEH